MDEVKLLPCPFCGSERAKIESCYVRCMSCCADGPVMDAMPEGCEEDETGAIWNGEIVKLWNTRPTLVTGQLEGKGDAERNLIVAYMRHMAVLRPADARGLRVIASDVEVNFHRDAELNPDAHPQPGPSQ